MITLKTRRRLFVAAAVGAMAAAGIAPALAAGGSSPSFSTFGDATVVPNGESGNGVQAVGNSSPAYGGVEFLNTGVTTVSQLNDYATDYKFTQGTCGSGSPRLVASVTSPDGNASGNIFFYIGPPPDYSACPSDVWASSGNLAAQTNDVDTTQLPGGTFYDPYSDAQQKYGDYTVNQLFFVSDSGPQTVIIDNTQVNDYTYTYGATPTSKNQCKNGGYTQLTEADGMTGFDNQGQCVSYVNHQNGNG